MRDLWGAAVETTARWLRTPVAFVRECLGVEPEPWQAASLEALPTSDKQADVGSKGTGKSALEAWKVWWFLFTRHQANVAITSISGDNLRDGLWKELAKWQQRSPILLATFEWQQTRITSREYPATWWASARQWSKSADAQEQSQTLAGLHADCMMFVIDEAGSVPLPIMVTAEAALASGRDCKLILAGNPTSLDGSLYHAAVTHRQLWNVHTVTGDPQDPKRSSLVRKAWAQQQIDMWGRSSPWVMVNVLGQFPPASLNALLGPEDVDAAMKRHLRADAYTWAQKRLGVDVARFGDDRTVIFPRQGLAAFRPVVMRHARGSSVSVEIATAVMAAKARWHSEVELFDATGGWAAGAVDVLRASGQSPIDVQFAAPASDPRYANRRAELWFAMSQWIQNGGALPNLPELRGELVTPTYFFLNGRFQLEPKDAVKARLGRSPDLADALALTFGLPEMPAALAQGLARQSGKVLYEFDPFAEGYR
ncbi:MAG: hypothetical protein ACRD1S_00950 [Vicinamibacterales bacterium]